MSDEYDWDKEDKAMLQWVEQEKNRRKGRGITCSCELGCEKCCTEECPGCADCYEDPSDYKGMGWVGRNGRP